METKQKKNPIAKLFVIFITLAFLSNIVFAESTVAIIDANLMSQDPDPVYAGDTVELRFSIENIGYGNYENLVVELEDNYPFTIIGDNIYSVGTLLSGQNDNNKQILKFNVKVDKDSVAGTHTIILKTYKSGQSTLAKTFDFEITVKAQDSIDISSIDKNVVVPGKEELITFKIKNVGTSNIKNINFVWENSDKVILPVNSDNSAYISSLNAGEEKEVSFNVIASTTATADLYEMKLTLSYTDSLTGNVNSIQSNSGIYVGGETDFDIVYSDYSDGEYAFTIANIGANDATSIKVTIPEQTSYTVSQRNSEILGNLNKGDYTTTSFSITSTNTKTTSNKLKILIEYTNTLGLRESVTKEISLNSATSATNQNSTMAIPGQSTPGANRGGMGSLNSGLSSLGTIFKYVGYGVVVLIIGIIGYMYYRKKNNIKHR